MSEWRIQDIEIYNGQLGIGWFELHLSWGAKNHAGHAPARHDFQWFQSKSFDLPFLTPPNQMHKIWYPKSNVIPIIQFQVAHYWVSQWLTFQLWGLLGFYFMVLWLNQVASNPTVALGPNLGPLAYATRRQVNCMKTSYHGIKSLCRHLLLAPDILKCILILSRTFPNPPNQPNWPQINCNSFSCGTAEPKPRHLCLNLPLCGLPLQGW